MSKPFAPSFQTPPEEQDKTEINKRHSGGLRGTLAQSLRDEEADISWSSEQLAKSYGIYLEFNRAKSGREKDWMYMVRIGFPGGGPIAPEQWALLHALAQTHGRDPSGTPSLRLTTRQAVQFHWVDKPGVLDIVKRTAEAGMLSLNACGDNVRNVMACPLHGDRELPKQIARYFMLPQEPYIQIFAIDPQNLDAPSASFSYGPQLLNRKFKMAISGGRLDEKTGKWLSDNCVEVRTHDLGLVPVPSKSGPPRYQIFLGGGQGEKFGKPTQSMLSEPFALVPADQVLPTLDAIVALHQAWGDRKNRHWARIKYLIKAMGISWMREQVAQKLRFPLALPLDDLDPGPRHLHHGWHTLENGKLAFGAFIENGRLRDDSPNGQLLSMVEAMSRTFRTPIALTPNQDLLFLDIQPSDKDAFETGLQGFGFGMRNHQPYSELRLHSGACVGRDTCRLAYTDSEKFEPALIDALEERGWGTLTTSIGITGCERQCFRPATKAIGLIGSGLNRYQLKLFGTEDGRHQGIPLSENGKVFLKNIPRDQVPDLLSTLFSLYRENGQPKESVGYFLRRLGPNAILEHLRQTPQTAMLVESSAKEQSLATALATG